MDAKALARNSAISRMVVGTALVVAPGLAARAWVGDDADSAGAKVLARALGVRDLALGLGVVLAMKNDAPVRGWLEGAALSDVVDFGATVAAGSEIPQASRFAIMGVAAASTVQCAVLAHMLGD